MVGGAAQTAGMRAFIALMLMSVVAAAEPTLRGPDQLALFAVGEFAVTLPDALAVLSDDQVHDAYDADRNGAFVRVEVRFTHQQSTAMTVPGFARRERPDGPWSWCVRWSPTLTGTWRAELFVTGANVGKPPRTWNTSGSAITVSAAGAHEGHLLPGDSAHPRLLRQRTADGGSRGRWLFGANRAWVVANDPMGVGWSPVEGIDRERELFPLLRSAGYDLLGQWFAPWELQLVHRDQAEHWRGADGAWTRHPLKPEAPWSSWRSVDQGRAAAVDDLVRLAQGGPVQGGPAQGEGGSGKSTIFLLLSPMSHKSLAMRSRNWSGAESNWSVEDDTSGAPPVKSNGFSTFREPPMSAWDFFAADPAAPLDDWRCKLFDAQAAFWRYNIARWGAYSAVGLWSLGDEIDATGDQLGLMRDGSGWFARPEGARWLANTVRLFRGHLARSDGLAYAGDPWGRPLHAATTSIGSEFTPGGNLEWDGGPAEARLDSVGWHWYPRWAGARTYDDAWGYTIDGILAFAARGSSCAPLISEFGCADRRSPEDEPATIYPTLYHHAVWASLLSGQAGTVMDWDDGKEFGELRWRDKPGAFDREHYPVDNAAQITALRRFLVGLDPGTLEAVGGRIRLGASPGVRAAALVSRAGPDVVHGWAWAAGGRGTLAIAGLTPGTYRLTWVDPWTGDTCGTQPVVVTAGVELTLTPVLAALRAMAPAFPMMNRADRGKDVAFHLVPEVP